MAEILTSVVLFSITAQHSVPYRSGQVVRLMVATRHLRFNLRVELSPLIPPRV